MTKAAILSNKSFWITGLFALLSMCFFTSCDDDDDRVNQINRDQITQVISRQYPSAQVITMEKEMYGYDVELRIDGQRAEMLLADDYSWIRTEYEDIDWNTAVPEAVKNTLTTKGYTFNLREDDVDRIEVPNGNNVEQYYAIELDREPTDIHLNINPDGTIRP